MTEEPFKDLGETHETEESFRAESMKLVGADHELARRLTMVQKAMTLIFGYTVEHTGRTDNERTIQILEIRLFNAGASSVKLALSGYYQTAFQQARDIMETGFLVDYLRTSPDQIDVWRNSDRAMRRKLFDPVKIRMALDERDKDESRQREKEYGKLSELASHATYRGFRMTTRQGFGELGPFVEAANLKAWLEEMVIRLGPAAVLYANHFPNADPKLEGFFRGFGTELVTGYKKFRD
jgi:hypothetical protein